VAEAVDNDALEFMFNENPWFSQNARIRQGGGGDAAQSAEELKDGERSVMQTRVIGPGTISFYWKVSSENGDTMQFYINSEQQAAISQSGPWEYKSYEIDEGTYTLRWRYFKDGAKSAGYDCGWVDEIVWQEE
jgi:hypothetical protein